MYAILSHGGRQYRVSAGDRLVVDRLEAEVGSVVALEPVLLTGGDGETALGNDVDGIRVAVTVVSHLRGEKLRIFKYKAKKRYRRAAGHRSDLTELRVESILAKGDKLPTAVARAQRGAAVEAEAGADTTPARPAKRAPARGTRAAKPAAATPDDETPATATPATPKPARRTAAKRAPKTGASAAPNEETGDGS